MDSIEVLSAEMRQAVSDAAAAVLPEHDPMCRQGESWICDCAVIAEARQDERARAVAAVKSCRDGYAMAIGASPEPPERYWLPRDAVIKAIEALGDRSLTLRRVTEPTHR